MNVHVHLLETKSSKNLKKKKKIQKWIKAFILYKRKKFNQLDVSQNNLKGQFKYNLIPSKYNMYKTIYLE